MIQQASIHFQISQGGPVQAIEIPSLEALNMDANCMNAIYSSLFSTIQRVEFLILSNNEISIVHRHAFIGLGSIFFLDLSNNYITEIDLSGIGPECSIDLSANSIKRLQDLHGLPIEPYWLPMSGNVFYLGDY